MDGGWGKWGNWKDCTVACGGGNQTRTRVCNLPKPLFGGKNCADNNSKPSYTQRCNENKCIGMENYNHNLIICQSPE